MAEDYHLPVLLQEVIDFLGIEPGKLYVDATLGGGGHAQQILLRGGMVLGVDLDEEALFYARQKLSAYGSRLELVHDNFKNLPHILQQRRIEEIDGIIFDLGLSSHQIDTPARGFSYKINAPLDMRFNQKQGFSAFELLNNLSEEELRKIISKYGEEKFASLIAKEIVKERRKAPLTTSSELVALIDRAIPSRLKQKGHHPARRTFQALRIAVNDELKNLEEALYGVIPFLAKGGRICVITFHSLEDRLVKNFFREKARGCVCPPQQPVCTCNRKAEIKILTPRPLRPSAAEIENNPRAKSAKLRVAEKI